MLSLYSKENLIYRWTEVHLYFNDIYVVYRDEYVLEDTQVSDRKKEGNLSTVQERKYQYPRLVCVTGNGEKWVELKILKGKIDSKYH